MSAPRDLPGDVREAAEMRVMAWCLDRIPEEHREEIRIEYTIRGRSITIVETRPPWREDFGPEWSRNPIAQLRFDPQTRLWTLHWPDRNTRWHVYDGIPPAGIVDPLLEEIDRDPTAIFWG